MASFLKAYINNTNRSDIGRSDIAKQELSELFYNKQKRETEPKGIWATFMLPLKGQAMCQMGSRLK